MLKVNGEIVDPTLIEDAFTRFKAEAEMFSQVSCCERDAEFRQLAEEEVIDGILLSQEADRRVPEPLPSEVRDAFEDTLRRWREHGASWELIESRRREIRDETVSSMKLQRFTEELWQTVSQPASEEISAWYHAHSTQFRTPAAATAIHLLRRTAGSLSWEDYDAMLALRQQALDGGDFSMLAKEHTQKRDGETDLGWVEHERLHNPFESMLFSLREGEISPVFFYEQAFHLIQVTALRPSVIQPLEEVSAEISATLVAERRRGILQQLALTLRASAVIERD